MIKPVRREPAGFERTFTISADPEIFRRFFAAVRDHLVAHLRALVEAAQASLLDSRDVHEDILAAVVRLNETKALGRVEPFHSTCRHVRTPCLSKCDSLNPPDSRPQEKPAGPAGTLLFVPVGRSGWRRRLLRYLPGQHGAVQYLTPL
jgi:hypothetical protein